MTSNALAASLGPLLRSRWSGYAAVLLLALLPLTPSLFLYQMPSVDGPSHFLEGYVIANLDSPGHDALGEHYVLTKVPTANSMGSFLLAVTVSLFPLSVAERVFSIVLVSIFAGAIAFAVRSIDRRQTAIALLAAPLATGYLFVFGFYNFWLGTALGMLALGIYLRNRRCWTPSRALLLCVSLILTAAAHLLPFAIIALAILTAVFLQRRGIASQPSRPEQSGRVPSPLRGGGAWPLAALVPPTCVAVLLVAQSANLRDGRRMPTTAEPHGRDWWAMLLPGNLARVTIGQVSVYDGLELAFGMLLYTATAVLVIRAFRRRKDATQPDLIVVMGVMALLCGALYLWFPPTVGSTAYTNIRFALFAFLFLLLVAATGRLDHRWQAGIIALSLVVTAGLSASRISPQREDAARLHEYFTAAKVLEPNTTFVTLRVEADDYDVTASQASRLAIASRSVQLNHLDGGLDYFPAHFKDRFMRAPSNTGLKTPKEWRNVLLDVRKDALDLDYVLIWNRSGAEPNFVASRAYQDAYLMLNEEFVHVWTSEPRGLLEVYERRE
jgi:hypothetical protein